MARKVRQYTRSVTTLAGPRTCGVKPIFGQRSGRRIRDRGDGTRRCQATGVQSCKSITCATCTQSAGTGLAVEVQRVANTVIDDGGSVAHLTIAAGHDATMTLAAGIDTVQAGYEYMMESVDVRDLTTHGVGIAVDTSRARALYERSADDPKKITQMQRNFRVEQALLRDGSGRLIGYMRAFECTWCDAYGWHPHYHVLLCFDAKITAEHGKRLETLFYRRFGRGVELAGGYTSRRHAVKVQVANTREQAGAVLGVYLGKLALEIGRPDRKEAKIGEDGRPHWGPYQIAETLARQDEFAEADRLTPERSAQFLALWHEFERDTLNRQRVSRSDGWNEILARSAELPVRAEDVEVPAELPIDAPDGALGVLFPDTDNYYRTFVPYAREFDRIAEAGGWGAATEWLDVHSVIWKWELPPDDPVSVAELMSDGDPPF